jgi:alcohol dehydrogenase
LYAVRLIAENLPRAVAHGWDVEARSNMSIGSLLAGIVINTSGCINVHALAEPMGGLYHKPHGFLVGATLPYVLEFLLPGDTALLAQIAEALGARTAGLSVHEAARQAIVQVKQLLAELEFPRLGEAGLKEEDIPQIAQLAMGNACNGDSPCDMVELEYQSILKAAVKDM